MRGFNPLKLFILVCFMVGINILAVSFKFTDFARIQKADDYAKPSILFGFNPEKNDFEPIAEFYQFSKVVIKLSDLEPEEESIDKKNKLVQCFVASEDSNFFNHFGLDLRGIARAFVVNLIAGRVKEGASTITQQAARLKFLNTDRSFIRKAREAWLAILLEFNYSKEDILEMYLNEIPLGHGTLGVGAAARFFFRKSVNELSWGEAAMLSSLTTRPREFSPIVNPNLSSSKVRINFMKLIENGKMDVSTAEKEYRDFSEFYSQLNRSPNDSAYSDRLNRFPYFTEQVRRTLLKSFKPNQIYNGGLKVYSTLNIQHQSAAEEVLKESLINQTKISNQRSFKNIEAFDEKYGAVYELLAGLHDMPDFKFKIDRNERKFLTAFQEDYQEIASLLNYTTGTSAVGDIFEQTYLTQNKQDHLLPVEGSLISIRPITGEITAIVGGSEF
ncbi:MAG: transglycosylase domain-containing protein, partial [Leptospiraceae bacterium]|nr:transglycosylase domain-containing protein [Leptospiraceae bacterium]